MIKKNYPLGLMLFSASAYAIFPDSQDQVPIGWAGNVFHLSQSYPLIKPKEDSEPWLLFNPVAEPEKYVSSLYRYVLEGNVTTEWEGVNNKVRTWYHAPWMHYGPKGREFIRGLTRERTTPKSQPGNDGELGPLQKSCAQNWAVSLYNSKGGYQIGQVWRDNNNPDPSQAIFPEGTVVVKLLFTTATIAEVPYLKGTLEWTANINDIPATDVDCRNEATRSPQKVRLLQMDLAVKDKRVPVTGWVFATMSYDGNASGKNWFERMIPVGSQWGNDPKLTNGSSPSESWINPENNTVQHLGYQGRLNGPVDNPRSACMSCHATAQVPALSAMIPPLNSTSVEIAKWFRNIPGYVAFDNGSISTDYSLQLASGIQSFQLWKSRQSVEVSAEKKQSEGINNHSDINTLTESNSKLYIGNDVVYEINRD